MQTLLRFVLLLIASLSYVAARAEPIDRRALVERHDVQVDAFDPLDSLTVGNGGFAFTVDATGLQTFPDFYRDGVPLGTQAEWGWHTFPNDGGYRREETFKYYEVNGRKVPYSTQIKSDARAMAAANYFRQNPHRLHLGAVGFVLKKADGSLAVIDDIQAIDQRLDLWNGVIRSTFAVDRERVEVLTVCHPERDLIAAEVRSKLLQTGRLQVRLRYPYPSGEHADDACDWSVPEKHVSAIESLSDNGAVILHTLDGTSYRTRIAWEQPVHLRSGKPHTFDLEPEGGDTFAFAVEFAEGEGKEALPRFAETNAMAADAWHAFWSNGGAVDFSGSTDPRANELERRVVLSQYLTRVQCAGNYPPQETGLTYNSWYGKFHLEMHWWHGVHWALWNRPELLEQSLGWYENMLPKAQAKAKLQGYAGARWPKMTDSSAGDSPSSVGEFLIWQQPHIIFMAELLYRSHPSEETLQKYKDLVSATTDFIADFPVWQEEQKRFVLGPPLIPAQESLPRESTINPPFELVYWRMGLRLGQEWNDRLGYPQGELYIRIRENLPSLAQKDGLYLAAESAPDSYSNERTMSDHPIVLGAFGMLPGEGIVDESVMRDTLDYIVKHWNWDRTWGWDYPLAAMCATRLGKPKLALDLLLMDVQKNTYLKNGHNYQDERLRLYLPGNGGLLTAVAMMCAGYDGCEQPTPGFNCEGWQVRWENMSPMP